MTILSQSRRQYTTDYTCVECVFFNVKDFCFVLLGIVFQLIKIVFNEVEILF